MPVNLELKARISPPSKMSFLVKLMGKPSETLVQTDTYFCVKSGRLKLREFEIGDAELIFYRREEGRGKRWSNYTILRVRDVKKTMEFLKRAFGLGVVVKKSRLVYYYRGARIHLDRIRGLGSFIEFEVLCRKDKKRAVRLLKELSDLFCIEEKERHSMLVPLT